jgi:hypothetical protein
MAHGRRQPAPAASVRTRRRGRRAAGEQMPALGIDRSSSTAQRRPTGDRLPPASVDVAHWLECMDAVVERLGAREEARRGEAAARDGAGVALAMKHTMTPSRSEAIVAALPDGSVEVRSSLVDMGQGLPAVLVRAAVEALGVPAGRVRVLHPTPSPVRPTTSSSRGTWAGSTAVRAACADLRGRLELPADGPFPSSRTCGASGFGAPVVGRARLAQHPSTRVGVAAPRPLAQEPSAFGCQSTRTGVVRVTEAFGAAWAGRVVVPMCHRGAGRAHLQVGPASRAGLPAARRRYVLFGYGFPPARYAAERRRCFRANVEQPPGSASITTVAPAVPQLAGYGAGARDLP